MEEIIFKLVKETGRQRFYSLSKPVLKAPNKNFDFETERSWNLNHLKDDYKKFHTDAIEYVCVSDAHTHVERLLFLAIPMNEEKTDFGCMSGLQLDGKQTFMIDGGDSRDVHPDEVYLRRLASVNGFNFKLEKYFKK